MSDRGREGKVDGARTEEEGEGEGWNGERRRKSQQSL